MEDLLAYFVFRVLLFLIPLPVRRLSAFRTFSEGAFLSRANYANHLHDKQEYLTYISFLLFARVLQVN